MKRETVKKIEKEYYIHPDDLKKEVDITQRNKQCTDKLATYLITLHKKVLNFPAFRTYSIDEKNEMMSYSLERILKRGIYTADINKNLFAYFTSGIFTNYQNYLKRYYKRLNQQREYEKQVLLNLKCRNNYVEDTIDRLQNW